MDWVQTILAQYSKKGGPGSGNFGHAGRPGQVGGSTSSGGKIPYSPKPETVDQARSWAEGSIGELATDLGTSREAIRVKCQKELAEYMDQPVSMRRSIYSAGEILDTGKFLNQFQAGQSGGDYDPEARLWAEQQGLGVPKNLDYDKRPFYGYIPTPSTDARFYGQVEFVFKPEVKERTTFTLGDSLDRFAGGSVVGAKDLLRQTEGWDREVSDLYEGNWRGIEYIEAQIHGGLSIKDVAKVRFHPSHTTVSSDFRSLTDAFRERGIEVEYSVEP